MLSANWRWNGIYLVLCVTACAAVGILCYRTVEMPLFRFFDRLTKGKFVPPRMAQASA